MAFNSANLALIAHGNGFNLYYYDAGTDTLATILASGYFNNKDDTLNLAAGDSIFVKAANGFQVLRVDTVNATTGVVTTERGIGESKIIGLRMLDIGTATSQWMMAPFDGYIGRMWVVAQEAIDADTVIGIELANVDVTGCQVTMVASGSAAGDVFTGEATAAHAVTEGQAVEITTDGANSQADDAMVYVEFIPA